MPFPERVRGLFAALLLLFSDRIFNEGPHLRGVKAVPAVAPVAQPGDQAAIVGDRRLDPLVNRGGVGGENDSAAGIAGHHDPPGINQGMFCGPIQQALHIPDPFGWECVLRAGSGSAGLGRDDCRDAAWDPVWRPLRPGHGLPER